MQTKIVGGQLLVMLLIPWVSLGGIIASFDFTEDPGWTREGSWSFGVPQGGGTWPGDPDRGYTGTNVFGYNLAGDYESSLTNAQALTAGPFDFSAYSNVTIRFQRWLGVESRSYDQAAFQTSLDGLTWTSLWENPYTTVVDASWTSQFFRVSVADGQPAVYFRWTMGPTDFIYTYAGWNLDDVIIEGETADGLSIHPAGPLHWTGPEGGPFEPSSASLMLTNTLDVALSWQAGFSEDWLLASATSGSLAGNGAQLIQLRTATNVSGFIAGLYTNVMTFTNLTSGAVQLREAILVITNDLPPPPPPPPPVTGRVVFAEVNLDSDPAWTLEGNWQFGAPLGQGTGQGDPTAGFTGANVIGYNLAGDYEANMPRRYATTGPINCSPYTNVMFSFQRWLGVETRAYDGATVEVSADGIIWTTIWTNPAANLDDGAWTQMVFDVSSIADRQSAFRARWGMGPSDGIAEYCGWNIDDVQVSGYAMEGLVMSPSGGFASTGLSGGPFNPTSMVYTLSNPGTSPVTWSAGVTSSWVTVSPSSGTLPAGGAVSLLVRLTGLPDSLPLGIYGDRLLVQDLANGRTFQRTLSLSITTLEPVELACFDLSSNPGWSTTGDWNYGRPWGSGTGNKDPSSGYTGQNVFGNNLYGDYGNSIGTNTLTTGSFDVSGYEQITVRFHRWLGVEEQPWDTAALESRSGSGPWTRVWTNPDKTIAETNWHLVSHVLPESMDDQSSVHVRWVMGPTDDNTTYCGWNIDDICILGIPYDDFFLESRSNLVFKGYQGGPFSPASEAYTLRNRGSGIINWQLKSLPSWLVATPTSGTLSAFGTAQVTVRAASAANNLPGGTYSNAVIFRSTTSGRERSATAVLQAVGGPRMTVSPGPYAVTSTVGGVVSRWMTVSNAGPSGLLEFSVGIRDQSSKHVTKAKVVQQINAPRIAAGHAFDRIAEGKPYRPGELLVRFRPSSSKSARASMLSRMGVKSIKALDLVPGLEVIQLPKGMSVEDGLAVFNAESDLYYAEPNYLWQAFATYPDDSSFGDLWGLHNTGQAGGTVDADIDAPEAWDITTGSRDVIVAVIDTGIDYNHPDLVDNMWKNTGEVPGNGVDDDGNGFVDDVYGYDFANGDGDPMDDHDHGTHCAGTVGATGNNNRGVAGVNWQVRLMALKFLTGSGSGSTDDAIDCINYAVANGAKVLSNSWGGGGYSQSLKDAIDAAALAGVAFVAAAGNDSSDNDATPNYPSNYESENMIAVMSTDRNDVRSSFSNYGRTKVHVGAPGSAILSTTRNNGYQSFSGTSMATPHVAGVCGLLLSVNPYLNHIELRDILMRTVDTTLANWCASGGRVNAYRALGEAGTPWLTPAPGSGKEIPGGASVEVELQFSGAGLPPGFYAADIVVSGNDPITPSISRSASMRLVPDDLVVSPDVPFSSTGLEGGPFSPSSAVYVVSNRGVQALSWQLSKDASWLTASPSSGVLPAGQSTPVTVSIDPSANTLPADVYAASMFFSNQLSGAVQFRASSLTVTSLPLDRVYFYDLEEDPGWTVEGDWAYGRPTGGGTGNRDPSGGKTGANVLGYNLNGDYGDNMPVRYLTSGPIDFSGIREAELAFWRWLGVEGSAYDRATVEVSNNGTTWTTVWSNPSSDVSDDAWTEQKIDISAVADDRNGVRIRWGMGPTDGGLTFPGWNLDDIAISGRFIDGLRMMPADNFAAEGYAGGPFAPVDKTYELINQGSNTVTWRAAVTSSWAMLSATSGTLEPGQTATVQVALSATITNLAPGLYGDACAVTFEPSGAQRVRQLALNVIARPPPPPPAPFEAFHAGSRYAPGVTNDVVVTFHYTTNAPNWFLWKPEIPSFWQLKAVEGMGNPLLIGGQVYCTGPFTSSNIVVSLKFLVPLNDGPGPREIGGSVDYFAPGLPQVASMRAQPDPLTLLFGASHTVTITHGPGGTVTPSGAVVVTHGGNLDVSIDPAAYHAVEALTVNQQPVAPAGRYQFVAVQSNQSMHATFTPLVTTNGVPLWWLASYGLTNNFALEAMLDRDGDRHAAWQEWKAGTDPINPQSVLALHSMTLTNALTGRATLSFPTHSAKRYRLWLNEDPRGDRWVQVPARVDPAQPDTMLPFNGNGGMLTLHVQPMHTSGILAVSVEDE